MEISMSLLMEGLYMDKQSIFKYEWILNTLDKMHNHQVKAETIKAVFNIPLSDAREILKQYQGGK
jgi:hypothetical protein